MRPLRRRSLNKTNYPAPVSVWEPKLDMTTLSRRALRSPLLSSPQLSCSLAYYPPGFVQQVHAHQEPSISLVLSGSVREVSGNDEVCLGPSQVSRKGEGVPHSDQFGPEGAVLLSIAVHDEGLWSGLASGCDWQWHRMSRAAISEVLLLARTPNAGNPLGEMLSLLGGLYPAPNPKGRQPEWLLEVEHRISSDLSVTIDMVAREVGLHPVYLSRIFGSWLGMTPVAYRQQQRTSAAIRSLLDGEPAARVAQESGFADQSHMCRSIKRNIGRSISELRAALSSRDCLPIVP